MSSPIVTGFSWGVIDVGAQRFRDARLFPGGAEVWDWRKTDTHHVPGIQLADAIDLLDRQLEVIVLSRGVDLVLQVPDATVRALTELGLDVRVHQSKDAVDVYNELASRGARVAALIHSTC